MNLRIKNPASVGGANLNAGGPTDGGDEYLARLVKLIPSEIIAIYTTGKPYAEDWVGTWSFICLGLVIIVRTIGTRQQGKPIQWPAVITSVISFVIWVYALGGQFASWQLPANIAAIGMMVWTFILPYFYKGD